MVGGVTLTKQLIFWRNHIFRRYKLHSHKNQTILITPTTAMAAAHKPAVSLIYGTILTTKS